MIGQKHWAVRPEAAAVEEVVLDHVKNQNLLSVVLLNPDWPFKLIPLPAMQVFDWSTGEKELIGGEVWNVDFSLSSRRQLHSSCGQLAV